MTRRCLQSMGCNDDMGCKDGMGCNDGEEAPAAATEKEKWINEAEPEELNDEGEWIKMSPGIETIEVPDDDEKPQHAAKNKLPEFTQEFIESQCRGMKAAGKGKRAQQLWSSFCRRERNKQLQQSQQAKGKNKGKGNGPKIQASWTNGKTSEVQKKIQAKQMPRKPAADNMGKQKPAEPMHPPKPWLRPAQLRPKPKGHAKPAGPVEPSSSGVKRGGDGEPKPLPPPPPPPGPAPVTPPEALAAFPPQPPVPPPPGAQADGKGGWYLPGQKGWIGPDGVWHPFPGLHYFNVLSSESLHRFLWN